MSDESRDNQELLIERVVSAYRERDLRGLMGSEAAFFDLDDAGRLEAFEATLTQRALERALHPKGLSTTAQAVMERILAAD